MIIIVFHDNNKLIKSPIDLSTIRAKAVALSYKSSNDLIDDFKMLLSNCETFNGKDSPLTDVARDMLIRVENFVDTSEIKEIDDFLLKNIVNIDNNNKDDRKEFSIISNHQNQGENVSILTDQEEEEKEEEEQEEEQEEQEKGEQEEEKDFSENENVNVNVNGNGNSDTQTEISQQEVLDNHEIEKICNLDINTNT